MYVVIILISLQPAMQSPPQTVQPSLLPAVQQVLQHLTGIQESERTQGIGVESIDFSERSHITDEVEYARRVFPRAHNRKNDPDGWLKMFE